MGRRGVFVLIMVLLVITVPLVFLEVAVRFISPQPEIYPRYRYSERYGHMFPESSTIINQVPGSWRFAYRTNEYGYRVSMPQVSNQYERPNIVILGDSSTFGIGVNDGEEYPAVLAKQLAGQADIVNLRVGSFGLTHEIRTFYEFGVVRGGSGFSDTGISGFRTGRQGDRRKEIHEEAQTEPLRGVQGASRLGSDPG
jgi:hypothetical protein